MNKIISFLIFFQLIFQGTGLMVYCDCNDSRDEPPYVHYNWMNLSQEHFTQNLGQLNDSTIHFYTDGLYFTGSGVIIRLIEDRFPEISSYNQAFTNGDPPSERPYQYRTFQFVTEFLDSNEVVPEPRGECLFTSNFFIGNDPSRWVTGVPSYDEIIYEGLYDGIDLVYRTHPTGIKYEYIVHPGAKVSDIKVRYDGVTPETDGSSVFIRTPLGTVVDEGLDIFQLDGGREERVPGSIEMIDGTVRYKVVRDPEKTLRIDPFIFSTYLGGNGNDLGKGVCISPTDSLIVCGWTMSTDFPVSPGCYDSLYDANYDIFVLELTSDGSRMLSATYLGGIDSEYVEDIEVDERSNIWLVGTTRSGDFPLTTDARDVTLESSEIFMIELNSSMTGLLYSSFLGGIYNEGGGSINLAGNGDIFISGYTESPDFPTTSGAYCTTFNGMTDMFAMRMNGEDHGLMHSTFVGGSDDDHGEHGAIDAMGNIYIAGSTTSSDFPTTPGAFDATYSSDSDAVMVILSSTGDNLRYSTYLGGSSSDRMTDISLDPDGNILLVGYTRSEDFPISIDALDETMTLTEGFLVRFEANATALSFSTFIGGSSHDEVYSVTCNSRNVISIVGSTNSSDIPTSSDAIYQHALGTWDAFFMELDSNGSSILYSTYLGGLYSEGASELASKYANIQVITGSTSSPDFPTTSDAFDRSQNGNSDVFVTKLRVHPWTPRNFTAEPGDGFVQLSWDPPDDVKGAPEASYVVFKGDGYDNTTVLAIVKEATGFNDTDLTNGVPHLYRIKAFNEFDSGDFTPFINATPGRAPDPPRNLTAAPGDDFITLQWEPPENDGGFSVRNYIVYRDGGNGSLAPLATLGNISTFIDIDVTNGIEYGYALSAQNLRGEGRSTAVVNVTPGRLPSPPLEPEARPAGARIELTWRPPEDDGGLPLRAYLIYRGTVRGEETFHARVDFPLLNHSDGPISETAALVYFITSLNPVGESQPSERVSAVPNGKPSPPRQLTAAAGPGHVRLEWFGPVSDGGARLTDYIVYKWNEGNSTKSAIPVPFGSTVHLDADVEDDVNYHYQVTAMNAVGESPPSNEAHATADTVAPSIELAAPREGSYLNRTEVVLRGTAFDPAGLSRIEASADGTEWSPCEGTHDWSIGVIVDEGPHSFRIRAIDLAGNINDTQVNVTVDITPPVLLVRHPASDSIFNRSNITVEGTSSDNTVLRETNISVEDRGWLPVNGTLTWSADVTLPEGISAVRIRSTDMAGNTRTARLNITVDVARPSISIIEPRDRQAVRTRGSSAVVKVRGSCSDDQGIDRVEVSKDGLSWIEARGTHSWSANLTLKDGKNRIEARVIDKAGNVNAASIDISIIRESPASSDLLVVGTHLSIIMMAIFFILSIDVIRRKRRP